MVHCTVTRNDQSTEQDSFVMIVTDCICQLSTNKIRFRYYNEVKWNLTQLATRRVVACCQSAVSAVVKARSALLASSQCDLHSVSWRPLSSFGLWIILFILLPPCLLPFYFSSDKSVWQVPGPICVGAHGWKARVYQGLACSRLSVNRVRCSDGGERVKSYVEETRGKNDGRVGRVLPFPFSLPFFFLVNFSTALYYLNAWNRLTRAGFAKIGSPWTNQGPTSTKGCRC